MTGRTALLTGVAGVALLAFVLMGPARAQLPGEAMLRGAEEHTTAQLPPPGPHTVYVSDMVFPHLIASKVYVVDGDKRAIVGMLNTGYLPNVVLAPTDSELYVAETFWSRGTRGDRTDVVTFYNPQTLVPSGEVPLPRGRFLVVTKKPDAGITPDGRFLFSFNMAPATSVSIVDVKNRRYVTDVETPGCALVFPTGNTRFASICSDGSLLTATFDPSGRADAKRTTPFFDPKQDPVFEHPGMAGRSDTLYFISYEGRVHPVNVSGDAPRFEPAWSLQDQEELAQEWRPGGWQLAALHHGQGLLFVLMHKGGKWTHKQAGEEVWIFDVTQKKRVGIISLHHHCHTIAVSQDDRPLLYALSETANLSFYDIQQRRHLGTLEGVGETPYILNVHGE
jgi:methylamine dehydrogenase heavy chain